MTRDPASSFPELRRFFSGYLHEDVVADSGTPAAALRAFWADADSDERRRFQLEAKRFLAHTAGLDLDALHSLIHQLGCRWRPSSRAALIGLLNEATLDIG